MNFTSKKCKICQDKASGIHYGVLTCDGCKNFFSRSISAKNDYKCSFGNVCNVVSKKRVSCRACRLRRCLEAGMSKQRIKFGRTPRKTNNMLVIKNTLVENINDNSKEINTDDSIITELENKTLRNSLSNNDHHTTFDYSLDELCKSELNRFQDEIFLLNFEHHELDNILVKKRAKQLSSSNYDSHVTSTQSVWNGIQMGIPLTFSSILNFAKKIPGLDKIQNTSDFSNMINSSIIEYLIIRNCPLIINNESFMVLPNDVLLSKYLMTKAFGEELVDEIMDFSNKFSTLQLTNKEYSLLFPIIFTTRDILLIDKESVINLSQIYTRLLKSQFCLNNRNLNFYFKLYQMMNILLPKLTVSISKNIQGIISTLICSYKDLDNSINKTEQENIATYINREVTQEIGNNYNETVESVELITDQDFLDFLKHL